MKKFARWAAGSFVLGACASFAVAAPAQGQSSVAQAEARALYDAAYDRWRGLPRRPYATYDQVLNVTRKGRVQIRRWSVALRTRDHLCRIVGVALDARDRPDRPQLTERCLAPDSALTFVSQPRGGEVGPLPVDLATPPPAPPANDEPHTLARVSVRVRPYDVTLLGDETVDGVATAHLALRPYRDPDKHIIRDVWIDRATNGVVRLHGVTALAARFATVDFVADYNEDATSQRLRSVAGFAKAQLLFVKAGADFSFQLTSDAYPATLPDTLFEPPHSAKHS